MVQKLGQAEPKSQKTVKNRINGINRKNFHGLYRPYLNGLYGFLRFQDYDILRNPDPGRPKTANNRINRVNHVNRYRFSVYTVILRLLAVLWLRGWGQAEPKSHKRYKPQKTFAIYTAYTVYTVICGFGIAQ